MIALLAMTVLKHWLKSLDKMTEHGGFNLTKWASKSKEVIGHIAKQDQTNQIPLISARVSHLKHWAFSGIR